MAFSTSPSATFNTRAGSTPNATGQLKDTLSFIHWQPLQFLDSALHHEAMRRLLTFELHHYPLASPGEQLP